MIILLTIINTIANLNYFGISYSFAQEGLGYGYNSMVMGGVQFFSIFFLSTFRLKFSLYSKQRSQKNRNRRILCIGDDHRAALFYQIRWRKCFREHSFYRTGQNIRTYFLFYFSEWLLPRSLCVNRSFCSVYSVNCGWTHWGTRYNRWNCGSIYYLNRWENIIGSNRDMRVVRELRDLACILLKINIPYPANKNNQQLKIPRIAIERLVTINVGHYNWVFKVKSISEIKRIKTHSKMNWNWYFNFLGEFNQYKFPLLCF